MSVAIYEKMLEIFSDPNKWTTRVYARDFLNNDISLNHPEATKWCALGLERKLGKYCSHDISPLEKFCLHKHNVNLPSFNDQRGLEAVRQLIKDFINDCQS